MAIDFKTIFGFSPKGSVEAALNEEQAEALKEEQNLNSKDRLGEDGSGRELDEGGKVQGLNDAVKMQGLDVSQERPQLTVYQWLDKIEREVAERKERERQMALEAEKNDPRKRLSREIAEVAGIVNEIIKFGESQRKGEQKNAGQQNAGQAQAIGEKSPASKSSATKSSWEDRALKKIREREAQFARPYPTLARQFLSFSPLKVKKG